MATTQNRKKRLVGKSNNQMLQEIDFILPVWLKKSIKTLPWIILIYVVLMYILSYNIPPGMENRLDELQLTGFIAYAAILFLVQITLDNASGMVIELWGRNIFPEDAKAELIQFSMRLENLANHIVWQIVFLLPALLIPLAGILRSCISQNVVGLDLLFCNYHNGAIRTSKSIFEMIIGFFMIMVVWRIFVLAWGIRKLGSKFDMTPNWHHPDKSGGLLPIGTVTLGIASTIAVPAIYIGTWQILCSGQGVEVCGNILRLESRMAYFQELLFVLFIVSLVSFVGPLWTTHTVMIKKQDQLQDELRMIGKKINDISQKIIDNVNRITENKKDSQQALDENDLLQKKLDALQKIYLDLDNLPVWPFNKDTVIQIISTQGIPLLGLTGIGSNVLDFFSILFKQK